MMGASPVVCGFVLREAAGVLFREKLFEMNANRVAGSVDDAAFSVPGFGALRSRQAHFNPSFQPRLSNRSYVGATPAYVSQLGNN